jgi:ABC-type Fe3+ transport system permease subunit
MRWVGWPAKLVGVILLAMLLVPTLAAWPASLIDRGPDGMARLSAFPLALTLFDPFVWTCVGRSVLLAAVASTGAAAIGLGLALICGRVRFPGRTLLWALGLAPMAARPMLLAPSLAWMMTDGTFPASTDGFGLRWIALAWVEMASFAPLVALATAASLRRLDPAWIDAALATGASRRQVWRDVVWPILWPGISRAVAMVFTLVLVEPAGPLAFGLHRTLASQIVRSSIGGDPPSRSAALVLLTIALAWLGRSLIIGWGGADHAGGDSSGPVTTVGPRRGSTLRSIVPAAWCVASLGPLVLWLRDGIKAAGGSSGVAWDWWRDPELRGWTINSATTAALAVVVDLVVLACLVRTRGGFSLRVARRVFESVPPLAVASGALALPWLLRIAADSPRVLAGDWIRDLATEFGPGRSPGWLLILCLAIGQWPMLERAAATARGAIRRSRVDASRLMGESDRRASRGGRSGWPGLVTGPQASLAFAMAATSLTPALLLTPFSERRTLASGIFGMILEPGPLDTRAIGPILLILAINLLALGRFATTPDHPS